MYFCSLFINVGYSVKLITQSLQHSSELCHLSLAGIFTTAAQTQRPPSRAPRFCVASPTTQTFRSGWWETSHMTRYVQVGTVWKRVSYFELDGTVASI